MIFITFILKKIYRKFFRSIRLQHSSHKEFLFQLSKYKRGYRLFCNLHEEYKKIYILPYNSLGDIYVISLFLQNTFCNKEDYILCVTSENCKYIALDSNIKNVIVLEQKDMEYLKEYAILNIESDNIKILHFHYNHTSLLPDIVNQQKMNFIQCYEDFVFHNKIDIATLKRKDYKIPYTTYSLVENDKSAIIAPYAKSIKPISAEFWNSLISMLKDIGIENIYTNCVKDEIPLQGTQKLSVSLHDIKTILNTTILFFGLRSGLCDFVSNTKCPKFILYPKTENYFSSLDYYSLAQIPFANNFHEYEIDNTSDNNKYIIQKIKQEIIK